jgi:hypothetical protein
MIHAGYLAPLAAYRVETDIDLSRMKTRMGDFVTSHLSQAVNIALRNDLVVKVFRSNLKDRQTLCFCVDVAHTHNHHCCGYHTWRMGSGLPPERQGNGYRMRRGYPFNH